MNLPLHYLLLIVFTRQEADAAESKAAALSIKVEALETVVHETKRASQQLLQEQDHVRQSAQGMETKFVQAQADLARSNAAKHKIQQEHASMKKQVQHLQQRLADATQDLHEEKEEKQRWKQQAQELNGTEKLQQERFERLEKELKQSKTLLMEATSAASESQQANHKVQASLERMEEANQQLSQKLQDSQEQLHRLEESQRHALAQAQKDHQATQHKWNHDRELVQNLKIEKQAADKKISQLQGKLAQSERRLLDSTNLTSLISLPPEDPTGNHSNIETGATVNDADGFCIPSLGTNKENSKSSSPEHVVTCTICRKQASGIMRKCQCGNTLCSIRAHATCVHRVTMQSTSSSVSHPGTPAPKLPIILCGNHGTKTTISKTKLSMAMAVTPASTSINRKENQ
jgi:myosin heavy subunit